MFIKIRLYGAILGVLVLYTFIHEFAYRKYQVESRELTPCDSDISLPDSIKFGCCAGAAKASVPGQTY